MIRVQAQAPSLNGVLCELFKIRVEFYHLYVDERDYSRDGYFEAIEKMLTAEDIVNYGRKVGNSVNFEEIKYV